MAGEDAEATDKEPNEDASTPSEELSPVDLLRRVKTWWKQDYPACQKWHKQAFEDFKFAAGDQWPEEDRKYMEDAQKRACLEFNQVDPVIDAVTGAEITNRQEVRYIPRQVGSAPVNDLLTEGARWFRDECDAEHEESNAFRDAVTCGMGWTETRLDYEENPKGDPKIERIDPIEMVWDYSAKKASILDARRIMRAVRNISLKDAKAKWPRGVDDKPIEDDTAYDATWAAPGSEGEEPYNVHFPGEPLEHEGEEPSEDDMVTVVQVQWYEQEKFYQSMLLDPQTGQHDIAHLTEEQHQVAGTRAEEMGHLYRGVEQTRRVYYKAYVGGEVLELVKMIGPSGKPAKSFSFHCFTAKYDRNKGQFYGLVRPMRGPQMFANKWLSISVEMIARGAKGGLMLEQGAVEDIEEFEEQWSTPGANSYFTAGSLAGQKVMPKPPAQFPSDFMSMTQFAVASIRDVTGVNVQALPLGSAGPDANPNTASQEYSRRQTATIILAPLFDSLKRYRRTQGRFLLWMIVEFLGDGRLVRISGPEGEQFVPLIHQQDTIDFDVIVDDAPNSPNQKELVWSSLVTMMPLITAMQPPPGVIMALLDYSPLPASVVSKVKQEAQKAQQSQQGQPSPMDLITMEKQADIKAEQQKNEIKLKGKQQEQMLDLEHQREMAKIQMQSAIMQARVKAWAKKHEADVMSQGVPGQGNPMDMAVHEGMAEGTKAGIARVATEIAAGDFAKKMGLPVGPPTHVSNASGVSPMPEPVGEPGASEGAHVAQKAAPTPMNFQVSTVDHGPAIEKNSASIQELVHHLRSQKPAPRAKGIKRTSDGGMQVVYDGEN